MPATPPYLSSAEVCRVVGFDRSTLSRWITNGTARPAMRLPGRTGAYLFSRDEADRLAELYARTRTAA